MKPLTLTRLLVAVLVLFAIGCGDNTPADQPSSCGPCSTNAIACQTTLDDCIVQGHGSCETGFYGDLVLTSDGITNSYKRYSDLVEVGGTWGRVDRTIALHPDDGGPDVTINLVEGETCPAGSK